MPGRACVGSWPSGPWMGQVGACSGETVPPQGRWDVWGRGARVSGRACLHSAVRLGTLCSWDRGHVTVAGERGHLPTALLAPESWESRAGDPAAGVGCQGGPRPPAPPSQQPIGGPPYVTTSPWHWLHWVGALAGVLLTGAQGQVLDHHSVPGPWARPSLSGLSFLIRPPSRRGPHQFAHLLPC